MAYTYLIYFDARLSLGDSVFQRLTFLQHAPHLWQGKDCVLTSNLSILLICAYQNLYRFF